MREKIANLLSTVAERLEGWAHSLREPEGDGGLQIGFNIPLEQDNGDYEPHGFQVPEPIPMDGQTDKMEYWEI